MWKWAIIGALMATSASAQELLTTDQMRVLPPKALDKKARADLLSVLEPASPIARGNMRAVQGVDFMTRPYGTSYEGLCQRNTLRLAYVRAGEDPKPGEAPEQPYGVSASTEYHVYHLPKPRDGDDNRSGSYIFDDRCDRLHGDKAVAWFSADDLDTAAEGTLVLQAALDGIKAGRITPGCAEYMIKPGANCAAIISDMFSVVNIDSVTQSVNSENPPAGNAPSPHPGALWQIEAKGVIMTVRVAGPRSDAIEIQSVDVEYQIVVT